MTLLRFSSQIHAHNQDGEHEETHTDVRRDGAGQPAARHPPGPVQGLRVGGRGPPESPGHEQLLRDAAHSATGAVQEPAQSGELHEDVSRREGAEGGHRPVRVLHWGGKGVPGKLFFYLFHS